MKGYRLYDIEKDRVIHSRNVVFEESKLGIAEMEWQKPKDPEEDDDDKEEENKMNSEKFNDEEEEAVTWKRCLEPSGVT